MSYQQVLERLSKLYEFRDIVLSGRRRGYLEHSEALRLTTLLKEVISDISDGEARLTLHLLNVVEELINDPGPHVKSVAMKKFGRDDVLPMPEILVESLPEPPLLDVLKKFAKGPIGGALLELVASRFGLSAKVLETLLSVKLRDLAHELGYLFESLLYLADNYAKILEKYVADHGVGELKLGRDTLSVFAEVVARTWLSMALKDPWEKAEPLPLTRKATYEFDAVSIKRVEDRVELHIAEIEVRCFKFLELENKRDSKTTRIEGKMSRLKRLLNTLTSTYSLLGARKACIKEVVLICFDDPDQDLKTRVLSKTREALEKLCGMKPHKYICPSFTPEENIKLYTGSDMLRKLGHSQPETRLRQAIKYIRSMMLGA